MLTLALAAALFSPQSVADREPGPSIRVELAARTPEPGVSMGWSPKGAKVPLGLTGSGALRGSFELGAYPARAVELRRSEGSDQHDVLRLDWDGNGTVDAAEVRTCTPKETRGKWWSSFEGEILLPRAGADQAGATASRSYPIAVWHVFDPAEPEAEPTLRWCRRGWCEGTFTPPGGEGEATLVLAEMDMDGRYDGSDAWALDRDPAQARRARSSSAASHAWLDGKAYRLTAIDPDGRHITLTPFDPGMTEEEERKANDRFAADRTAPRAKTPLAFRHDVDQALADAKATGKRVFLDFETTWCGPCKQMDQMVYTAQAVVTAAATADLICVKVDGDERRDLVKRFGVEAYPTLLVLSPEGEVLRREVGYRSVADASRFLGGGD